MIDAKTNEECPHAGQWIGISDGSSVYAWRCPDCGLERPKNAFTRGKWRVDSANERTTATASLAREGEDGELADKLDALAAQEEDEGWFVPSGPNPLRCAAARIRALTAENEALRRAIASDARIEAIFTAILTPRDNPEDGTRDHLPRPLRDYLNEVCGAAGLTGFNDGYAEAQGKFEALVAELEKKVERLERALEPFAFKSAPNSFAGTDGSVTECLVCDEDVRRARSELEGR